MSEVSRIGLKTENVSTEDLRDISRDFGMRVAITGKTGSCSEVYGSVVDEAAFRDMVTGRFGEGKVSFAKPFVQGMIHVGDQEAPIIGWNFEML